MAKFEYTTGSDQHPQTMEAAEADLDMGNEKLTFFDEDRKVIKILKIKPGASVQRLDKAS